MPSSELDIRFSLEVVLGEDYDSRKIDQAMSLFEQMLVDRGKIIDGYEEKEETLYNEEQCICDLGEVNEKYFCAMAEIIGRENFKEAFDGYPEDIAILM